MISSLKQKISDRKNIVLKCPHCGQQAMSIRSKIALTGSLRIFLCNSCQGQITLFDRGAYHWRRDLIELGPYVGLAALYFLGVGWLLLIWLFCLFALIIRIRGAFYQPVLIPSKPRKKFLINPNMKFMRYSKIAFSPLIFSTLTFLILTTWITAGMIDVPLSQDFKKFMAGDQPPPDDQNGYFAFTGLTAPADKDAFAYALERQAIAQKDLETSPKMTLKNYGEIFSFEGTPAETSSAPAVQNIPPVLFKPYTPNREKESFDCWLLPKANLAKIRDVSKSDPVCMNSADLGRHLKESELHLARYESMQKYSRFYEKNNSGQVSDEALITLNDYYNIRNILWAKQGSGDAAIRYWLADMQFLNRVALDQQTVVQKNILYILIGKDLTALKTILEADPTLATKHKDSIIAALSDPLVPKINDVLKSTFRAEYNLTIGFMEKYSTGLGFYFVFKPNATSNLMADYYSDLIEISQKPVASFETEMSLLEQKNDKRTDSKNLIKLFLYNPIGKISLPLYSADSILYSAWRMKAQREMLILYVMALSSNITPENMPAFLESNSKTYFDPYTGKPYRWDENSKSIYFAIEYGRGNGAQPYIDRKDISYP